MSNWNTNGRHYRGFPTTVRRQAKADLPPWCNHCGADDQPLQLDHIINAASGGPDTIDNAQWLCHPCHDQKTRHEQAQGRTRHAQQARHPNQPHPGLLPPSNTHSSPNLPPGGTPPPHPPDRRR